MHDPMLTVLLLSMPLFVLSTKTKWTKKLKVKTEKEMYTISIT